MSVAAGRERAALLGLAVLALAPSAVAAPKTDVVVLKNGDRLTGEVQQLERGRLELKTDDLGTVQIEWDKIASVTASAPFDVEDLHGQRYLGSLTPGAAAGEVVIAWAGRIATAPLSDLVRIRRLDTSFWRRLDGSFDVGTSYTSATSLFTLDTSVKVGIERPGFAVRLNGNATLTTQPDVEDTRRSELSLVYERRFEHRWVALVQGGLEQNRALGFDLRTSAAAGGGRHFVQGRHDKLLLGAGLSLNREQPVEGEANTNVDAVAMLNYDRFSYDFPKVDVSVTAAGFASLSDGGRWRLELDARLKRELVRDFNVTLRGYESYDSRPATEGAPTSDYGVTFALGWTF